MKHYPQFDVLRGFAAVWVFLSHALLVSGFHFPIISAGDQAVELFIILSGFVITLLIIKKHEAYTPYIFRRGVRLYPLFLVALFAGFLTSGLYEPVLGHNPFLPADAGFAARKVNETAYFWQHLAAHLTMLHGAVPDTWLPQSAFAFSGPLWSISLEWQFYLIAPFVVWCIDFRKRRWLTVAAFMGLIILARIIATKYWPTISVSAFLPLRLELFALGIFCALGWEQARNSNYKILVLIALATIGIYVTFLKGHLFPLAIWFAVYLTSALGDKFRISQFGNKILKASPAIWVGTRSYGLYVLHMPIVLTMAYFFVLPHADELKRTGSFLLLVSITVPVVLMIAAFCYRYVEQPTIEWGRKIASKREARLQSNILPKMAE